LGGWGERMKGHAKEWYYGDDNTGQWVGLVGIDELDALRKNGTIQDYTKVINLQMMRQGGMPQGIPFCLISRVNVDFGPTIEELRNAREGKPTTVLSGPNNCGKTLLLKQLFLNFGQGSYLIGCNRFSHIDVLNTRKIEDFEHRRYYDNFSQQFYTTQQNTEQNELQLEQVLTGLKNNQREKLFALCTELLGNRFSLQRTEGDNDFIDLQVARFLSRNGSLEPPQSDLIRPGALPTSPKCPRTT
jgi:hypothetical protein